MSESRKPDAASSLLERMRMRWQHLLERSGELPCFILKEARASFFCVSFMAAVLVLPRGAILGVPRYDVLLAYAIGLQLFMLRAKLESLDEFRTIVVFHVLGFALEVFKTSAAVHAWSYPEFAYTKVLGVPLFSGFMYASVGSYVMQAWRGLEVRMLHHPPLWMQGLLASLIYLNFFSDHYIADMRWYLVAVAIGLYSRTQVVFRPKDRDRRMPILLAFALIGFAIFLAENLGTFFGVWRYPNQIGAWAMVHVGKWSSWSLLVIMTFAVVATLKDIKARIHVASDPDLASFFGPSGAVQERVL
jgi:uncharacterized membrane protein YoaT (DUF817 family)